MLSNIPAIAVVLTDIDVLSIEREKLSYADLIELRVDMFENLDKVEDIFAITKEKFSLPILCTIRSLKEGGKKPIENRLSIYEKLTPYCEFFDIEFFSDEAFLLRQLSEKNKIKLIGSYHRFDFTPSLDDLERVFEEGMKLNADIIKIATMVNEKKDLETLLVFTLKHKHDKVVVIGMGEKGIPTRVINPVFGSLITYATVNKVSAPGQLSLEDIVSIFRRLGLRK